MKRSDAGVRGSVGSPVSLEEGVNKPIKTKLEQTSNFTRGTSRLELRHYAPTENFEAQYKNYDWKIRSEKLLSFLQVYSSQIDS